MIARVSRARKRRDKLTNDPVKVFADGSERCLMNRQGRIEYRRRTLEMRLRQDCICPICGLWLAEDETTFDHQDNRRVHLDERIEVDGVWRNAALHAICNGKAGSRHYHWINNEVYVPVEGK